MITTDQTVQTFLDFFRERGHELTPGGSLIPSPGDPMLFTTSGMHPLTPYLMGRSHPLGKRLTSLQRCLRQVRTILLDEERKFDLLLQRGRKVLSHSRFTGPLTDDDYHYLHDTHGLPRDLVVYLNTETGAS